LHLPDSESTTEVRLRLGGPAGFGIKAAGQSLARVFAKSGYETFDLTEYPSLIKGGHNTYHLRISDREVTSHVIGTDILVALDRLTVELHAAELSPTGAIIYDPDDFDISEIQIRGFDLNSYCIVPVPFSKIVRESGGLPIMKNVAALGAVLGYLNFPFDTLRASIERQFSKKDPAITEQNVNVARKGYEQAKVRECGFPFRLKVLEGREPKMLLDGNEAICLGALAAGIGLYCAYPMTPASSLLHLMAAHAENEGVVVKHTEDEIAAINMVIGGAFGGTRSMCATSGGGFSLMVEGLGFAGISETACVIGVFTRPGPATGMPTWTEQSDLRFVIHASQGEFPRVVLALGDHQDAFDMTWRAFDIADQLQTPVILLSDTYLSDNRATVPLFDTAAVTIERGPLVADGDISEYPEALNAEGVYARYKVTESGVSIRALPGVKGAQQIVNSYEHDEIGWGARGEIADIRIAQNEKRMRKLELAKALVPPPSRFGPDEAELSILFFGSTKMPTIQAQQWLAADGVPVNLMQVTTVWPFPAEEVRSFIISAKRTAIIEGNMTGQLRGLVREHCLLDVDYTLLRYDGRPFSPEQIVTWVKEAIE